jgi:plastocyanin
VTIVSAASTPPPGYKPGTQTNFGYDPDTIKVVIGKNNTVIWTSSDAGAIHTATDPGVFDSKDITTGSFQYTFTVPGTYHYTCIYHAWMQGTIVVVSG